MSSYCRDNQGAVSRIKAVIPRYRSDEKGLTVREIAEKSEVPEDFVRESLEKGRVPGVENTFYPSDKKEDIRYRQTKKHC